MSWCKGCGGVVQAGALQEAHTTGGLGSMWGGGQRLRDAEERARGALDLSDRLAKSSQKVAEQLQEVQRQNETLRAQLRESKEHESELLDDIRVLKEIYHKLLTVRYDDAADYDERLGKVRRENQTLQEQLDDSQRQGTRQSQAGETDDLNWQSEFYRGLRRTRETRDDRPAAPLNTAEQGSPDHHGGNWLGRQREW